MITNLINNQSGLQEIMSKISTAKTIAFDTEFLRRDTYYAKLALLQIALEENIYIIDTTLVDIKDLWREISHSKAVKIIHSGRQDLEIMYTICGTLPNNVFDTQIAAGFCGLRQETSYSELCNVICNIDNLDKNLQSTNWTKRPLTTQMINYAAIDVLYLNQIYTSLQRIISEQNYDDRFQEKTYDLLLNPDLYTKVIQNAWKKIKYYKKDDKFIEKLKKLSAFREESAQNLDIPKRNFLTDDNIIRLCNNPPKDEQTLLLMKDLTQYITKEPHKSALLNICSQMW